MTKKEVAKRYILFIIGLFFIALGVAFAKIGELGVSPVSSVANVLSMKFTKISIGNWLLFWNYVLIVGQILILRKKFKPLWLLQFPLSILFGSFADLGMLCVSWIPVENYPMQLLMVLLGIVTIGFGIALSVIANVIMNPGEMFVKVVADVTHKNFGNIKIIFDICNVALSVVLSMILFSFDIVGTREGTLITMLGTGTVVKFFTARISAPLERYLTK